MLNGMDRPYITRAVVCGEHAHDAVASTTAPAAIPMHLRRRYSPWCLSSYWYWCYRHCSPRRSSRGRACRRILDGGLVLRRSGFVRVVQPRGMTQLVQDDSVEVVDIGGAAAVLFQRTAVDLPIAGGVDDDVGVDVIPETVDLLIITTRDRERIAEASAVAEHPLAPAADIDAIVLARIDGRGSQLPLQPRADLVPFGEGRRHAAVIVDAILVEAGIEGHLILLPDDGQPHGLIFEIGAAIAVLRGVGVGAREPRKGRGTGDAKAQQTKQHDDTTSRARTRLRKASRGSDVGATCAAASCASPCRGSTTSRPAASFTMQSHIHNSEPTR